MDVQIIDKPFHLKIHGYSGTVIGKDYAGTAFKLMDRMWKTVKANKLQNKGLNIWIYEPNEMVFAGVELNASPGPNTELEQKNIILKKYAYCKHVGSYKLISQTGQAMREDILKKNQRITSPYLEIYGHWTNDESKLETELIMALI